MERRFARPGRNEELIKSSQKLRLSPKLPLKVDFQNYSRFYSLTESIDYISRDSAQAVQCWHVHAQAWPQCESLTFRP